MFTSAAKAMAHMQGHQDGEWGVRLVSRTSKTETAVFFARNGCTAVWVD